MTERARLVSERVHHVADAVAAAWHGVHSTGRLDVPVAVVATLAAAPEKDTDGCDTGDRMARWGADEFYGYTRMVWTSVIRARPEFAVPVYPLVGWIFEDPDAELRAHAHTVASAALRAGIVDLTGTDRRFEVDLLGAVLTVLRPAAALKQRGEFYTPPDIAQLMADVLAVGDQAEVMDPTLGTGGLFRAAAQRIRASGGDPGAVRWIGCDIDPMAVACAAVNSLIWGLGRDVLVYVGDCLTEEAKAVALAQRKEALQLASTIRQHNAFMALLNQPD